MLFGSALFVQGYQTHLALQAGSSILSQSGAGAACSAPQLCVERGTEGGMHAACSEWGQTGTHTMCGSWGQGQSQHVLHVALRANPRPTGSTVDWIIGPCSDIIVFVHGKQGNKIK